MWMRSATSSGVKGKYGSPFDHNKILVPLAPIGQGPEYIALIKKVNVLIHDDDVLET